MNNNLKMALRGRKYNKIIYKNTSLGANTGVWGGRGNDLDIQIVGRELKNDVIPLVFMDRRESLQNFPPGLWTSIFIH